MSFQVHEEAILQWEYQDVKCNWALKNCTCLLIYHPLITKRKTFIILGIINYLGKISPSRTRVCEPLKKLTSTKTDWTWPNTYLKMYQWAKSIMANDASVKFHNENEQVFSRWGMECGPHRMKYLQLSAVANRMCKSKSDQNQSILYGLENSTTTALSMSLEWFQITKYSMAIC